MAKSFLTDIQLNNNVLLNAKIQAWGSAPTGTTNPSGSGTAVTGQISSYAGALYIFNGTAWVAVGGGTVTIGSTAVTVNGSAVTTFAGLSSVTSTTFVGALTGNVTGNVSGSAGTVTGLSVTSGKTLSVSNTITLSASNDTSSLNIGTGGTLASGAFANISLYATLANPTFTGTVSGITSTMVGLGNVTNESKATMFSSPTFTGTVSGVTATHVGLGNVTNESKATMFTSPTFTGTVASFTSAGIAMGNNKITGLGTPTADTDAVTKAYVDTVAAGINVHASVKYATTAALGTTGNLVGGTITTTYANGTSGLGATLTIATSSTWTAITIDGQSLTIGDRVLIKNQATALQNGIYTVTAVGTLANTTSFVFTRAVDNDQTPEINAGDLTYVTTGTLHGGDGWVQTATVTTIGTDAVTWTQYSGSGAVPYATISSAGIASFPTAQFTVDAAGAVTIANLSGGTITTGTVADARIASALTGKTYNGLTVTSSTGTLTVTNLKTLSVSNTLTLAGTDSTTMTFPGTSATIARTDAAQTFTGIQTFTSPSVTTSLTTTSGVFTLLDTATTLNIATGSFATLRTINIGSAASGTGNAQTINIGVNSTTTATSLINIGGSTTTSTTITGTVLLPTVANSTAGFVKTASDGTLSRSAIAYSDLPTSSLTAVTTDGIARKKTGTLTANSSTTAFAINHQFGQWVTAQLFDASGNLVEVDVLNASTSSGTTTFTFAVAPTTGTDYKYVIIG